MNRRAAIAGLLGIGLSIPLATWIYAQRSAEIRLLRPPIEATTWTRYAASIDRDVEDPQIARVVEALATSGRAEVAAHRAGRPPEEDPALAAAAAKLEAAATGFVDVYGAEAYVDAGRRLAFEFHEALEGLLAHARAEGSSPTEVLGQGAEPVQRYVAIGGGFVFYAERGGFVRDGALNPDLRPMLQAVFLDHWMRPAWRRLNPATALRAEEYEWLLRWRLEWQSTGELDRRLEAADALRGVPGYPADVNAGVLLFQAGRHAEALVRFQKDNRPEAVAYARMAKKLARKQAKQSP
jgi:hypothetical protein